VRGHLGPTHTPLPSFAYLHTSARPYITFKMNINQPSENIVLPFMKKKKINLQDPDQLDQHRRLKIVSIMPNAIRNELVAAIGEFVGTFMFLFIAFSATQVANFVVPGAATAATAYVTCSLQHLALLQDSYGLPSLAEAWGDR